MSCNCSNRSVVATAADEACVEESCSCRPFYNGDAVQEEHCVPTTYQLFVTCLRTSSAFVMPACLAKGTILFRGLIQLQVGSYLWSARYGYLLVTGFDALTGDVEVQNECQVGNASPGTVIPQCSEFNVTDPPA